MSKTKASLVNRPVRPKVLTSMHRQIYPWLAQRRWFRVTSEYKLTKRRWAVNVTDGNAFNIAALWRTSVRLPTGKAEKSLAFEETGCK